MVAFDGTDELEDVHFREQLKPVVLTYSDLMEKAICGTTA